MVVDEAEVEPRLDALEAPAGLMTHFATADDRADGFLHEQLDRFLVWARPLKERRPDLLLHAANSAATASASTDALPLDSASSAAVEPYECAMTVTYGGSSRRRPWIPWIAPSRYCAPSCARSSEPMPRRSGVR